MSDSDTLIREGAERLDVGFAVFDSTDRLVFCNAAYREGLAPYLDGRDLSGLGFEELMRAKLAGGGFAGRQASGDPEGWLAERLSRRADGDGAAFEQRLSDGRWLSVHDMVLAGGGRVNWWTDVTESKGEAYQVDAMIESVGHGFAVWDQADRLIHGNQRFFEQFSCNGEPGRLGDTAAQVFARLADSGRVLFDEGETAETWVARRLEARRRGYNSSLLSFVDDRHLLMEERRAGDGSIVTVLVDVTELKRREKSLKYYGQQLETTISDMEFSRAYLEDHSAELASMTEELSELRAEAAERAKALERSNADLQQFAYAASHDLREPLRMVSSYLQLLGRRYADRLDDDAREFIGFAVDGSKRMDALILDLLQFSRVETRGEAFQPLKTAEVAAAALANLETAIAETAAQVRIEALPVVMGDHLQLVSLFQNLIANALKYHVPDRAPEILVSATEDDGTATFSIRDNGIGIAPEYFEQIFVIFKRLHARDSYGGTGIGLAVCKRIVERHGGRIWVESVPGDGSTFFFTLPTR